MDYTSIASKGHNFKSGCAAVIFGIILFIGSFVLLWMNETNYVKNIKMAKFIKDNVVSVSSNSKENNNKLVHYSGKITTNEILADEYIKVNTPALDRKVEMYQWEEKKYTSGSGSSKRREYKYRKIWSEHPISSTNFHRSGHDNPPMPVRSESFRAANSQIGVFSADIAVTDAIKPVQELPMNKSFLNSDINVKYKLREAGLYLPSPYVKEYSSDYTPGVQIGDIKITYRYIPVNTTVSVIAGQINNKLTSFDTAKYNIVLAETGTVSASGMIQHFEDKQTMQVWKIRLIGIVLMFIGIMLLVSPITAILSFIPLFGDISKHAVGLLAAVISVCLSIITIAVSWIAVRPEIAIPVVIAAAGGIFFYLTSGGGGSKNIPPASKNPQQPMPPV